jgi:hypothetical protein
MRSSATRAARAASRGCALIALSLGVSSCHSYAVYDGRVRGAIMYSGDGFHGPYQGTVEAHDTIVRHCEATVERDATGAWQFYQASMIFGRHEAVLVEPEWVLVSAPHNTNYTLRPTGCSRYVARGTIDAALRVHVFVDLDCTSPDGARVHGTLVSDDCHVEQR